MTDDKYKLFRNYMVNELEISKDDIMRWTKEAITKTVKKQIGQINVESLIESEMRRDRYNIINNTRKELVKEVKKIAEAEKVAIRNIRRDANGSLKDLLKEKEISEDDDRRGQDQVQKITDKYVALVEERLAAKEKDLMEI